MIINNTHKINFSPYCSIVCERFFGSSTRFSNYKYKLSIKIRAPELVFEFSGLDIDGCQTSLWMSTASWSISWTWQPGAISVCLGLGCGSLAFHENMYVGEWLMPLGSYAWPVDPLCKCKHQKNGASRFFTTMSQWLLAMCCTLVPNLTSSSLNVIIVSIRVAQCRTPAWRTAKKYTLMKQNVTLR